jgi:hypothetical protein
MHAGTQASFSLDTSRPIPSVRAYRYGDDSGGYGADNASRNAPLPSNESIRGWLRHSRAFRYAVASRGDRRGEERRKEAITIGVARIPGRVSVFMSGLRIATRRDERSSVPLCSVILVSFQSPDFSHTWIDT